MVPWSFQGSAAAQLSWLIGSLCDALMCHKFFVDSIQHKCLLELAGPPLWYSSIVYSP